MSKSTEELQAKLLDLYVETGWTKLSPRILPDTFIRKAIAIFDQELARGALDVLYDLRSGAYRLERGRMVIDLTSVDMMIAALEAPTLNNQTNQPTGRKEGQE